MSLPAHTLILEEGDGREEIALERIDGKNRYLLPERPGNERAWLATRLADVVARRAAGTTDNETERRRLVAMLAQRER